MKSKTGSEYDWAAAILAVFAAPFQDLNELAKVAELNPFEGDLSDMDCRGLDLSGQNLGGWDLRNARFEGAKLSKTELRGAIVKPEELVDAIDWRDAHLDDEVRIAVCAAEERRRYLSKLVEDLEFSTRTSMCCKNDDIIYLGDLVGRSEAEMRGVKNFGRKSLNEVKEVLAQLGLHLGMDVGDWSRPDAGAS